MRRSQFVVIGLGRFGSSVAKTLIDLGHEVLGVDDREEKVQRHSELLTHVVYGDATDEELLKSLDVQSFDVAIVAIGEDQQASILSAVILKDLGVKNVVTKAVSDLHGKVLAAIGADRVIYPERDMGVRLARSLSEASVLDYIELDPKISVREIKTLPFMVGKSLKELQLRQKRKVSVLCIKRGEDLKVAPVAGDEIHEEDILLVIGRNEDLDKLEG